MTAIHRPSFRHGSRTASSGVIFDLDLMELNNFRAREKNTSNDTRWEN
jgi:hypothetical protein